MHKTVVLNVVGPDAEAAAAPAMPQLAALGAAGARSARIKPAFPAVTCTAQSDYLTGQYPDTPRHRRQRLVLARRLRGPVLEAVEPAGAGAEDLGHGARRSIRRSPARTCSGGSTCTRRRTTRSRRGRCTRPTAGRSRTSTPRPATLRDELQAELGTFPLFEFWGPRAVDRSTRWIAEAAKRVEQQFNADADAGLPAAPRLQPAARRARRAGGRGGSPAGRRRLRRSDRVLRSARRAGDRAVGVRACATSRRRCTSIACCASTG